jgi:uncharacterized protein
MSSTIRPRDILMKLLEGISNQDWNAIADLYAEDVVIQWPFTLPGPTIIRGRANLQKALQDGWAIMEIRASDIRIYEMQDPEIIIAEYNYDGRARTTGKTFRYANILVLTVRDGHIVSGHGYFNHAISTAAAGILDPIIPAIELNPSKVIQTQ